MPCPDIEIADLRAHPDPPPHQGGPDLSTLLPAARRALAHVLALPPGPLATTPGETTLPHLPCVEVSLVDDPTIANLHGRFLDDPSPTDVITFQHGEIIISVDTATREAAARQLPVDREILLYLIHGLLHLNGYCDRDDLDRSQMAALQDQILAQLPA